MVTGKQHDLLLTGGRLIDPRNGIDAVRDIAIRDGRIVAVEPHIRPETALSVHELKGAIVVPGLIDLHTHVYHSATSYGVDPDAIGLRSGVTTMVDAGSAGAGTFAGFRLFVIE